MSQGDSAEMTQARFAELAEAYGGDVARWPTSEWEVARLWLASNPVSQALLSNAARLDRVLGVQELPVAASIFEQRLMADFDRSRRRWSLRDLIDAAGDAVWPGAPLWQPACALGLALATGLGIALFAPFDIPQQNESSTSVFALDTVSDMDAGQGI